MIYYMGRLMLFYHYSKNRYNELQSKQKQLGLQKSFGSKNLLTKCLGMYETNISLFLLSVPLKAVCHAYKNQHPFWNNNSPFYEHIVDSKDIPDRIPYRFAETDLCKEMIKQNMSLWDKDTNLYWDKLYKVQYIHKEIGFYLKDMIDVAESIITNTKPSINEILLDQAKRYPESTKYAAMVPHLMTYPVSGVIKVSHINKIVI